MWYKVAHIRRFTYTINNKSLRYSTDITKYDDTLAHRFMTCMYFGVHPNNYLCMSIAVCTGNLTFVKWIYDIERNKQHDMDEYCEAMPIAAAGGHLHIMQWLEKYYSEERWNILSALYQAIQNSHIHCIKWLLPKAPISKHVTDIALPRGNLQCIKLLYKKDASVFQSGTDYAISLAAVNGHLHVVQWLHFKGCRYSGRTIDNTASAGHLECAKWLHAHRTMDCSNVAMDIAANNGHLHVVQWLHNIGKKCTKNTLAGAARAGHLHILQWLFENCLEIYTCDAVEAAIINASQRGHLQIVQYLVTHRVPDYIITSISFARAKGHTEVEKYLRSTLH